MKHRRIPKKNRKKLKSVDPFNKNIEDLQRAKTIGKNLEPSAVDDQPIPHRLLEIKRLMSEQNAAENDIHKRRKHKNIVHEAARRAGFLTSNRESTRNLVHRVSVVTYNEVQDQLILAKHYAANSDIKELKNSIKYIPQQDGSSRESQTKSSLIDDTGSSSKTNETAIEARFSRKRGRRRAKKRRRRKNNINDNAYGIRENISFGDRVNNPPQFSGELRERLEPVFRKAGKKQLLLKKVFAKNDRIELVEKSKSNEDEGNTRKQSELSDDLRAERRRVIEAYRKQRLSRITRR